MLTQNARDPITPLQEISQKQYGGTPKYDYTQTSGASHNPVFKAKVYVNDVKMAEAEGRSKRDANKKTAKKAYSC